MCIEKNVMLIIRSSQLVAIVIFTFACCCVMIVNVVFVRMVGYII